MGLQIALRMRLYAVLLPCRTQLSLFKIWQGNSTVFIANSARQIEFGYGKPFSSTRSTALLVISIAAGVLCNRRGSTAYSLFPSGVPTASTFLGSRHAIMYSYNHVHSRAHAQCMYTVTDHLANTCNVVMHKSECRRNKYMYVSQRIVH